MNKHRDLRNQLRTSFYTIIILGLITLSIGSYFLTQSIANNNSIQNASFHGSDLASRISSHIKVDVNLVGHHAKSPQIIDWLKDEENMVLKEIAFEELSLYRNSFYDQNIFIAVKESGNFYSLDKTVDINSFKPVGILDENILEDSWFFNSLQMEKSYNLNVDVDRFIETLRVWINMKVQVDDDVLGIIGTGMHFGPFVEDIFKEELSQGATSILIDSKGNIQVVEDLSKIQENSFLDVESRERTIFSYFNKRETESHIRDYLGEREERFVLKLNKEDYDYMVIAPLEIIDWYVVTLYDNEALYSTNDFIPIFIFILLITFSLVLAMDRVVFKKVLIPHQKLIQSVVGRDRNDEQPLFGEDREDEIGDLSSIMSNFMKEIDRNTLMLEHQAESISKRLDRVFRTVPFGVFVFDSNFKLVYINAYINRLIEGDLEELYDNHSLMNFGISEEDFEKTKVILSKGQNIDKEVELISKSGQRKWCKIEISCVHEKDEITYEGILVNLQMQKEYERKLLELTRIDELTGLFNRRYFYEIVSNELVHVHRYQYPISIIMYDIDHFKQVNDQFGHEIGDQILIGLSALIKKNIRENDMLVRWGGEEFIVLMPHANESETLIVASKLRQLIESYKFVNELKITCSFGVAAYTNSESYESWFNRVDCALLKAKKFGRNRAETYTSSMHEYDLSNYANDTEYKSEIKEIDDQHMELFDWGTKMLNHFSNGELTKLNHDFIEMKTQIENHFESEEKWLETFEFDDLEYHKSTHRRLIKVYSNMHRDIKLGLLVEADLLSFIVEEILIRHTATDDHQFMLRIKSSNDSDDVNE